MITHSTICRARWRPWPTLLSATAAAALFGCSGPSGSDGSENLGAQDLESESLAPATPLTPEEREAEFQRQVASSLSEQEMLAVENALRESKLDVSELSFAGRLATLGDLYLDVDPLLRAARNGQDVSQKGRTLGLASDRQSIDGLPVAPIIYSTDSQGSYFFWRPDIFGVIIVVPDEPDASFLFSTFQQAGRDVAAAADDCLREFRVMTLSQYEGLSQDDKILNKAIFVRYGERRNACPRPEDNDDDPSNDDDAVVACALFPRTESREFDINLFMSRLVPGPRIGVNSALVSSADPHLSSLTHELLHTLGLAHSNGGFETNHVPGSSCSGSVDSIMRNGGNSATITEDDQATIDVLYSPLPGASCVYRGAFNNLGPQLCP